MVSTLLIIVQLVWSGGSLLDVGFDYVRILLVRVYARPG